METGRAPGSVVLGWCRRNQPVPRPHRENPYTEIRREPIKESAPPS